MCGIVGYIGNKNSADILIDGLKKLEYRGYDSAGIAVYGKDGVKIVKTKGRMQDLEDKLGENGTPEGVLGIGHTRWATHGAPSDINSHPHRSGKVTVVHNGIIENYSELREELEAQGRVFLSQTDTECVSHTIDSLYSGDPVDAIFKALKKFRGSYALGIIFDDCPDVLYAVRKDSPLIVGIGEGENFIASDIPAILSRTNKYYLLEANELAVLKKDGIELLDENRNPIKKDVFVADWDVSAAEKGGYPHFMIKEIHEQPRALRDTISPRLAEGIDKLFDSEAENLDFNTIKRVYVVACGSAMHAGMVGRYAIEKLAGIPVQVEVASEFRYDNLLFQPGDAVLLISQSGETADTLAALRIAKDNGIPTIAIVNVVGSSIAREADMVLYTWAGPEIAVATTKAYTCQVSILLMLALRMAIERNTVPMSELQRLGDELERIPEIFEKMLEKEEEYKALAQSYKEAEDLFFIGRGYDSALCWEASIKLKEVSYIHSEAYAAGELKHGTISLIDEGYPVVGIATSDAHYEKTISNVEEVLARGARVILLCTESTAERLKASSKKVADDFIAIPDVDEFIRPLAAILPLQIFAYYAACARGCDVDKPKNLAKSVTVE